MQTQVNRGALAKGAVVVAGALLLLWLAVAVTIAGVFGNARPDLAGRWSVWDAQAQAGAATEALRGKATPTKLAQAESAARGALLRSPINVDAARSLAIASALGGSDARAERLIAYAETLSRRDLPTQLWLIERAVTKNDIPGALVHYDRALRTSPASRQLLFSILIKASDDPAIAEPLGRLLATRPPWWREFINIFVGVKPSPAAVTVVMRRLNLGRDEPEYAALVPRAVARLIEAEAYAAAFSLFAHGRALQPGEILLRDGGFESGGLVPPFDWQITDEPEVGAIVEQRDGASGSAALFLHASPGRGGEVARQLLTLPSGSYALRFTAGNVGASAPSRPRIVLTCAGSEKREISNISPEPGTSASLVRFQVPSGRCAAQWLSIQAFGEFGREGEEPWIDGVSIRPAGS